ncbi:SIS domain-containing protein [Rhodococcus fascians]|nr:SIS domain-containing protein [Rhodococcus fascians]MBY3995135.1 SIS domain-containing protein [Rhodococcus fascians]MBY4000545.1 SIS domain-containing protein [Rhodococcus fascians]MBY4005573.1 SIS domain-containing protein [Rhodococcus fascians]MBY4016406.1 SIS domain-containing protein [Rhodococcus fascians]
MIEQHTAGASAAGHEGPDLDRDTGVVEGHFDALCTAARTAAQHSGRLDEWGRRLADMFAAGGRLLACGNGGSAAEAQHLTGELVGRFRHDRHPLSAIALHADTSAGTAIVNDYGEEELFARQVRAHGRAGDVLVLLSTSGTSRNVLAAAKAAQEIGVLSWSMTGPAPNPLAEMSDSAIAVEAPTTATVQEIHLALVHGLCISLDRALRVRV